MWPRFTFLAAVALVIGFLKTEDLAFAAKVVAWLSPIFLLASYFSSRPRAAPTRGEKLVAYGWLAVRRLFCFAGAALFLVAAVTTVIGGSPDLGRFIGAAGLGALSVFLAWSGVYGEGRDSHRKRMARYDSVGRNSAKDD